MLGLVVRRSANIINSTTVSFVFKGNTGSTLKSLFPFSRNSLFRAETRQTHHSHSPVTSVNMAQLIDQAKSKEVIDNVDTFMFDCDGVLWDGHGAIPGSLETLLKLKELGKKIFYVTNNSSKSRQEYVDKCKQFGFPAEKEDIVCTAYIAAAYLQNLKFQDTVYVVGKAESLGEELRQVGIKYIGPGPDPLQGKLNDWLTMAIDPQPDPLEGVVEDWLQLSVNPEVKCVLVGFDPHISYMKILKAATFLKNPDCLFIGTNEDSNLPAKGPVTVPGTGCMVVTVAHAAQRKPDIMGKPEKHMFEILRQAHNLDPARCLMVGDSLHTDIKFAQKCGMKSMLVLSGITTLEDMNKENAPSVPELYAPRLDEMLKHL